MRKLFLILMVGFMSIQSVEGMAIIARYCSPYRLTVDLTESMNVIFKNLIIYSINNDEQIKKNAWQVASSGCSRLKIDLKNLKEAIFLHGFDVAARKEIKNPQPQAKYNSFWEWVVADHPRKGKKIECAQNMILIIEYLIGQLNELDQKIGDNFGPDEYKEEAFELLQKIHLFFELLSKPSYYINGIPNNVGCAKDYCYFERLRALWKNLYYPPILSRDFTSLKKTIMSCAAPRIRKVAEYPKPYLEQIDKLANQENLAGIGILFLDPGIAKPILKYIENHRWIRSILRKVVPGVIGQIEEAKNAGMPLTKIMDLVKEKTSAQVKKTLLPLLKKYGITVVNPSVWLFNKSLFPVKKVSDVFTLLGKAMEKTAERPTLEEHFDIFLVDLVSKYKTLISSTRFDTYCNLHKDIVQIKFEDTMSVLKLIEEKKRYINMQERLLRLINKFNSWEIIERKCQKFMKKIDILHDEILRLVEQFNNPEYWKDYSKSGQGRYRESCQKQVTKKGRKLDKLYKKYDTVDKPRKIKDLLITVTNKLNGIRSQLKKKKQELKDYQVSLISFLNDKQELISAVMYSDGAKNSKKKHVKNEGASSSRDLFPMIPETNKMTTKLPYSLLYTLHNYEQKRKYLLENINTEELLVGWLYSNVAKIGEPLEKGHDELWQKFLLLQQRVNKAQIEIPSNLIKKVLQSSPIIYNILGPIYSYYKRYKLNTELHTAEENYEKYVEHMQNNSYYQAFKLLKNHPIVKKFEKENPNDELSKYKIIQTLMI